jgi:hypothetical protein
LRQKSDMATTLAGGMCALCAFGVVAVRIYNLIR